MNDNKEEERKAKARERLAKRSEIRKEVAIIETAKKTTMEQKHRLMDGRVAIITRSGNHVYKADGGSPMPSVSSFTDYVEKGAFGAGMGYATKLIRENGGDTTAPRRISDETMETGSNLHQAIDDFIRRGTMNEDPLFVSWYQKIGRKHKWLVSEQFIYHPMLKYGGTADALSEEENGIRLWDWKTRDSQSYDKTGSPKKDHVQAAAYVEAYRAMGSEFLPTSGMICYIMRDTGMVQTVRANIKRGWNLFRLAHQIHYEGKEFDNDE